MSSEQPTKVIQQILPQSSASESTVSSRSSDVVEANLEKPRQQRGRTSSRRQRSSGRNQSNESPQKTNETYDSNSVLTWSVSDDDVSAVPTKDYPAWTRCSFKPWNESGESNEFEDISPVIEIDAETYPVVQEDNVATIFPAPEKRIQEDDSGDEVSVASSVSSNESDFSDFDSLNNFLKKVFRCSTQHPCETKEVDDEVTSNSRHTKGGVNKDNVDGDKTTEGENMEPDKSVRSEGSVWNMGSSDAIYTSHSSPSRRRYYKSRSILSDDELSRTAVDSVIEMSDSMVLTTSKSIEPPSDIADEERNPEGPNVANDSNLDEQRTKEEEDDEDDDEEEREEGEENVEQNHHECKNTASSRDILEPNELSTSLPEMQGWSTSSSCRPKADEANKHHPKTIISWTASMSPRTPNILRDQVTMLPDNLPPMARLRYCRNTISTAMYV